jgi:hypothetical protein
LKKTELRPFPGQEPTRHKDDPALFDSFNVSKPIKLFDGDLPKGIEEHPNPRANPYTLVRRKRRPRPYRSPTGEVVLRLRGGKGFVPIYEPWKPEGLLRVRGRLMPVPKVVEMARQIDPRCDKGPSFGKRVAVDPEGRLPDIVYTPACACGRSALDCRAQQARKLGGKVLSRNLSWLDYPRRWNAVEPGPGPYVLRAAAELAAAGADVSGSNLPGVREYAE